MITPVYIIGHLNPDTDAIASAMGYAWLLGERDGRNTIAARAGAVNPQTAWVLKTIGLEPPPYLADASPRFERIARALPPILPDRPLREAWAVAAALIEVLDHHRLGNPPTKTPIPFTMELGLRRRASAHSQSGADFGQAVPGSRLLWGGA